MPELIALAETRAGRRCDNLSVVAMTWGEDEGAAAADDPRTVPAQGGAPTDVQDFTATDPDFLRMTDEDIERAIEEIQDAIRKHVPQNA